MKLNYIAGEWRTGADLSLNVSPSDISDVIGEFTRGDENDVADAVSAAQTASKSWAFSNPQDRFHILDKAGDLILQRQKELGELLAREEGKTIGEATGEVVRAGQVF